MSGFRVTFVREPIPEPTEWRYDEPHHVIAIYEGGQMRRKEVEFERGPHQRKLPRTADVMVIPAGVFEPYDSFFAICARFRRRRNITLAYSGRTWSRGT
ncbi:Probable transcriptional regulator%2C AraC family [Mycobacteroides abscessus]|nr:hypothetical protein [Mycobacteroides abscessus]SKI06584.1 Probable transcriptional regulator, AraC family [Mycobacteroides abscessus subsp. massiliense]CPT20252.1 Probable transcriptional regulator%2C AraC family [Mycobacteroides abscessus]CPU24732.1 Probable transcriptional regulator%2C AraC family [Mycobacteroides abscessus]SKI90743.1 Probable transcriptional regulator, AraC family [Mycobacteroides abscessus subsp. massiliense]